ncbi:MAG: hypothetical protein WB781_28025 [Candidatus Sulfotelmatobacter sp.]
MSILRRILVTVVIPCGVILAGAYWIAPIALSFYAAKKVPATARAVPTDLKDHSVSQASGMRLSYVGYDFEVPWSDLDNAKTTLYPNDKSDKTEVVLAFRSGLRLMITAVPAREFAHEFATDFKMSSQKFDAVFGDGTAISDYLVAKDIYDFSPNQMHYWSLSSGVHYREQRMLTLKSILPAEPAESGIFNIQNASYKGFQQGNPQIRQDNLLVNLYSDDGSVQIKFCQKDYRSPTGVTQPEINRIVQSLQRKAAPENSAIAKSER